MIMPDSTSTLANARKTPPWRLIVIAAGATLIAAAILGLLSRQWGTPVLNAGYITLMFLAPAVRTLSTRELSLAAGWALLICFVSVLVGTHGPWVLLVVIVSTALVQGLFAVNGKAGLNRSPASAVGFAAFADTGEWDEVCQPMVGVAVGAAVVLVIAVAVSRTASRDSRRVDTTPAPLAERLYYGIGLAVGCAVLTVVFTLADWGGLSYALLVFCLIYAFDSGTVLYNSLLRVVGAGLGVGSSVLLSAVLPHTALIVVFAMSAIMALACLLDDHEFWFVVFLVATVVHMAEITGKGAAHAGLEHILDVVLAAAVAVLLHQIATPLHNRLLGRPRGTGRLLT